MRLISEHQFLEWALKRGVEIDPRWSRPGGTRWLKFQGTEGAHRFWVTPEDGRGLLEFVSALLGTLDAWETCCILKREGGWTYAEDQDGRSTILNSIGVPESHESGLEVTSGDSPELVLVLMLQLAFGWCTHDDVWVLPDHGRQLLFTDHHGVVHVQFQCAESVVEFAERMRAKDFELPAAPPDESFRWPDWMGPKPETWPH